MTRNLHIENEELPQHRQRSGDLYDNDNINYTAIDKYILPEFIVNFDTIVNRDTFSLRYEFPRNLFHFDFGPHKDSLMFQQLTIEHKITETKTNWWTTFIIATGSCVAGYLLGSNRK